MCQRPDSLRYRGEDLTLIGLLVIDLLSYLILVIVTVLN